MRGGGKGGVREIGVRWCGGGGGEIASWRAERLLCTNPPPTALHAAPAVQSSAAHCAACCACCPPLRRPLRCTLRLLRRAPSRLYIMPCASNPLWAASSSLNIQVCARVRGAALRGDLGRGCEVFVCGVWCLFVSVWGLGVGGLGGGRVGSQGAHASAWPPAPLSSTCHLFCPWGGFASDTLPPHCLNRASRAPRLSSALRGAVLCCAAVGFELYGLVTDPCEINNTYVTACAVLRCAADGFELYDLVADPYEINNTYETAALVRSPAVRGCARLRAGCAANEAAALVRAPAAPGCLPAAVHTWPSSACAGLACGCEPC